MRQYAYFSKDFGRDGIARLGFAGIAPGAYDPALFRLFRNHYPDFLRPLDGFARHGLSDGGRLHKSNRIFRDAFFNPKRRMQHAADTRLGKPVLADLGLTMRSPH